MPPKAKLPAPIDRPLSRAYLREFTGWSTAYPPGLSDPTSLRLMENMLINRDGSVRVRPGLRYMSYNDLPTLDDDDVVTVPGEAGAGVPAGTHESFFLNDGSKAYLYAVREDDDTVGFRVLANTGFGQIVHELDDAGIEFDIPQTYAEICFTAATRYVKFLQVDNKIFALSDAGETMREFFVGATKRVKKLASITRPEWTVLDKLTVVHPDASWINSSIPTGVRTNLFKNPSFEVTPGSNEAGQYTSIERSTDFARTGTYSLKMTSAPERTNLYVNSLRDPVTNGISGFGESTNASAPVVDVPNNAIKFTVDPGAIGDKGFMFGPQFNVVAGQQYKVALDIVAFTNVGKVGQQVRFYNSAGAYVGSAVTSEGSNAAITRRVLPTITVPASAVKARIWITAKRTTATSTCSLSFKNVTATEFWEATTFFDGASGANYFWEGTANASASVYHPPQDINYYNSVPTIIGDNIASIYARAATVVRSITVNYDNANPMSPGVNDAVGSWTRIDHQITSLIEDTEAVFEIRIQDVPRGEYHYIDNVLFEHSATLDPYFDGSTADGVGVVYEWTGTANASYSTETTYAGAGTTPTAETKTANTLISSTSSANDYNFGFFYTFNNEIGESAPSQATIVKTQRAWSAWQWETPNVSGEPSGTAVVDPNLAADQLVAFMTDDCFNSAIAMGAIQWNLYMFTWTDQDPVPVTAIKVGVRALDLDSEHGSFGWLAVTPAQSDYGTETALLPSLASRINYSDPSKGGQGLVAADRMILVKDPTAAAVIRWTSNLQGSYTDFSANKGGGYKTLTSGNLMIPAAVKLWQNPQSADTLTILCTGVDGHSTGYYMAPAQVASQSEATNIMGFEETTATPGTVSPYGCEVLNNALYHPLDEQLMKSTASNYNINHKAVTDQIQDRWRGLLTKQWIIAAQHDNRIYLIVNNPNGVAVPENCNGNEIWVFDAQAEAGTWSRWLIPAVSLRKVEQRGNVFMSVIGVDGIYYLDENYPVDDYVNSSDQVVTRAIPWLLETNTQGANRAHDAWCHLQQLNLVSGNFTGTMRYGIRSWDINGRPVTKSKIVRDLTELDPQAIRRAYDVEDQLLVDRDVKEWYFFAESVLDEDGGTVLPSYGQLNLVQYRYTPVSVNVGYEHGSVETFEYGRATVNWADRTTDSGVPIPTNDQRRP